MSKKTPAYGNAIGFVIFHLLIKVFGMKPAYWLLALILPYYVFIRKSAGQSAHHYLKHRFPEESKKNLFRLTYKYFNQFGKSLIDQAAMGILNKNAFTVHFPEQQQLYDLVQKKRGVVLLTTHAGYWRTAMGAMGKMDVPVNFLFETENDEGRHFFDMAGERNMFKFISPKGFMGGLVEATNVLNEGEVLAIMGDRAFGTKTVGVNFLGEEAPFPISPYKLCLATGADLVVLLTARTGPLNYSIEYKCITEGVQWADIPKKEALPRLAQEYVKCLEVFLRRHPFMWYNFFNFWQKQDVQEDLR